MKKLNFALTLSALFILAGCGASKDYTPPVGATGEQIFSTACTECHKPLSANVAMILSVRKLPIRMRLSRNFNREV